MKKRRVILCAALALALCGLIAYFALSQQESAVVMRTSKQAYTEDQIRTRIDFYCRKYHITSEMLQEDADFWNQMVDDMVYESACAELAWAFADEQGLLPLTAEEEAAANTMKQDLIDSIGAIGEDLSPYLKKLGITEEQLTLYAQAKVLESKLTQLWAKDIVLSNQAGMADYQKLLHYTQRMWDEIHQREDTGEFYINTDSLTLQAEGTATDIT